MLLLLPGKVMLIVIILKLCLLFLNLEILLLCHYHINDLKYFLIGEKLFRVSVLQSLTHTTEAASYLRRIARFLLKLLDTSETECVAAFREKFWQANSSIEFLLTAVTQDQRLHSVI